MPNPTPDDLNSAAQAFFRMLMKVVNQPRGFDPDHFDEEVAISIEASRSRQDELDDQLRNNEFDAKVEYSAGRLARKAGGAWNDLDAASKLYALQLAARAEREQMRYLVHALTTPHLTFEPLFKPDGEGAAAPSKVAPSLQTGPTLAWCVDQYQDRMRRRGVRSAQINETSRALRWLIEHLGGAKQIDAVTPEDARGFRDGLERLDNRHRGLSTPFSERQTDDVAHHNSPVMATKYWAGTLAFFAWSYSEKYASRDPAHGIETLNPVNVAVRTPPPFSRDELARLFQTPPYAGCQSHKRPLAPGGVLEKGSHYWSGLIALYTGMRAGEIAQLQVSDFDFESEVPVVRVSMDGDPKLPAKMVKTRAAIRDVPISKVLLELGIRDFVAVRAKGTGSPSVFPDLKFGAGDRRSDGLTKFWGRLLRKFDLHKPGRATHVFRHTVASAMRHAGVTNEIIGWVLGHASPLEADGYGKTSPVAVMAGAIAKIDYGIDVVSLLRNNEAQLAFQRVDGGGESDFDDEENVV
jgi:integrase